MLFSVNKKISIKMALCTVAVTGLTLTGQSQGFDLSKFKRSDLQEKQNRKVTIINSDFQQGGKGWTLRDAGTIDLKGGRNGTSALKIVRANPNAYSMVSQSFKLKSNKFYRFGAWVKTENIKAFKGGAAGLCIEFSGPGENGKRKYMSGYFHSGISGSKNWTLISASKRVPPKADSATIALYLWKGATGTAWYDDVFLTEQGTNLWTAYSLSPYDTPIDGKCTIVMFYDNEPIIKRAAEGALYGQLYFEKINKTVAMKIENNRAVFDLKGIPEGRYNTNFYCLDTVKKIVLYSKSIPVTISNTPLKRKVALDRRGRTLIDGKPFLPIGVFTAGLSKKDIDALISGGVNCALPYGSMSLSFHNKQSIDNTREVLDYCAGENLKIIFSGKDIGSNTRYAVNEWYGVKGQDAIISKLVKSFKDHPAILAWYINDEQPVSEVPRLTKMRQLYNKLDPDHPTYGLDYKYESLPMCGSTADIFGIDYYPIGKNKPYSLIRNEYAMKQLKKLALPMWVVPQMMNMGAFYAANQKDCAEKFRNPTEDEMRSMVLLEVAYGAKGFIFYHYDYLKSWKLPKDNFQKTWPEFCGAVKTLHELTPFILSDKDSETIKLTETTGQVRACKMTDNSGNQAVLLIAIGSDDAKASFALKGKYQSRYGKTTFANGKYTFQSKGISSDVLYFCKADTAALK